MMKSFSGRCLVFGLLITLLFILPIDSHGGDHRRDQGTLFSPDNGSLARRSAWGLRMSRVDYAKDELSVDDERVMVGGSYTYFYSDYFSIELSGDYLKTDIKSGASWTALGYPEKAGELRQIPILLSGRFSIPVKRRFVPYIGGGIGFFFNDYKRNDEIFNHMNSRAVSYLNDQGIADDDIVVVDDNAVVVTIITNDEGEEEIIVVDGEENIDTSIDDNELISNADNAVVVDEDDVVVVQKKAEDNINNSMAYFINLGMDFFLTRNFVFNFDAKYIWNNIENSVDAWVSIPEYDYMSRYDEDYDGNVNMIVIGLGIKYLF